MGDERKKFEMPPPPKPLSFEMPKPPNLQPNISGLIQKPGQPTVIPNPFAPRPKSISPNIPATENVDSVTMESTKPKDVEKMEYSEEKNTKIEKADEKKEEKSEEPENEKLEKPNYLPTSHPTHEIPITPMVEDQKEITSPATVEVSSHAENVKLPTSDQTPTMFSEKVDMSGGLMSWITKTVAESKFMSDVAEKAKIGVETVITTLDPGMKPFLAEHGVIEFALFNCDADILTVASDAFTRSGAMAICRGLTFDETAVLANFRPLVLGESRARKLCEAKIEAARKTNKAKEEAAIVVVQPFLMEISGRFYSTSKILLHHDSTYFDAISQLLEVSETIVEAIQRAAKSEGLPDEEYSMTVTQAIRNVYKTGVSSWEPGCLAPYDSKELLSIAFSSVSQQLLRNLAPVN